MKKILTINPGSTSTKFKVYDLKGNSLDEKVFTLKKQKQQKKKKKKIEDLEKIAIRVVHGGDISKTSKITQSLKKKISKYTVFAPIHNKRALEVIAEMEKIFPKKPMYACFDTAFHTTIPTINSTYLISSKIAKKHNIKKYGFHGLAVSSALAKIKALKRKKGGKLPQKIICAHLGGGSSITAVKNGKSFITSMGLTPLSGIPMITRSGNVDPDIFSVLKKSGISTAKASDMLNTESGFYGLTESKDTKKIIDKAQQGSKKEKLAFDIFVSEIVQKIWAYAGLMQGIDAIAFSGGIGYGNTHLRREVSKKLKPLHIKRQDTFVIDVDEELVMFNQVKNIK